MFGLKGDLYGFVSAFMRMDPSKIQKVITAAAAKIKKLLIYPIITVSRYYSSGCLSLSLTET